MKIQIFPLTFEGKKRIGVKILGFDRQFPKLMKLIPGSRWTPKENCWHFPDKPEIREQFTTVFQNAHIAYLEDLGKKEANNTINKKLPEYKLSHVQENALLALEKRMVLGR